MATDISTPAIDNVSVLSGESVHVREFPSPLIQQARSSTRGYSRSARFQYLVTRFEVLGDGIAVAASVVLAYTTYYELNLGRHIFYTAPEILAASFVVAIFYVMMLKINGAYRSGSSLLRVRETERVLRVSCSTYLLAFAFSFLVHFPVSRWVVTLAFVIVPFLVLFEKHSIYCIVQKLHVRGYGVRRVVIYGAGMNGQRVFSALARSPKLGLDPVAFVDDDPARFGRTIYEAGYTRRRSATVSPGPVTDELLRQYSAELVIIADASITPAKFNAIAHEVSEAGATLAFFPHHSAVPEYSVTFSDIDGIMLASVGTARTRAGYEIAKRVFDFVASLSLIVLSSPLLLLAAALVKLTSPGPALFTQKRVGKDGRIFDIYKFRTMHVTAPRYACSPKTTADPRITKIGAFLRRTSLDEIPQLINVLKGDMSLVGPRPEMPFIVAKYRDIHRQRLQVQQGITGLWQLSADRAYAIHENIHYDLYYIRNRNFFMDIAILLHTIVFAMRGI